VDIIHRRDDYDAVVVGLGPAGSWVAKELASAGASVVVLEAGPLMPPEILAERPTRLSRRKSTHRQFVQSRSAAYWNHSPELFVDDIDNPYAVLAHAPFTWIRGRQAGGRSLTWGGVTLRLSDYELKAPDVDGIGGRWPIGYEDIAPYYAKVERFLGVAGTVEGLSQYPDGVFLPGTVLTPAESRFKTAIESRWAERHVLPARGVCDRHPEESGTDSRWPSKTVLHKILPAALRTGNVTIRPDTIVSHLDISEGGKRVQRAMCIDRLTREPFGLRGRVFVLCASTIETVRILLNSRSRTHPDGIGNSTGRLGLGLTDHLAVYVGGPLPAENNRGNSHRFGGPHSICIPRFRNLHTSHSSPFVRGYGVWGGMGRQFVPGHPETEASWFLTAVLEVLVRESNRVTIADGLIDAWGIGAAKVVLQYGDNESLMADDASRALNEMAAAARLEVTYSAISTPGEYIHELGGVAMGLTPTRSVLNSFNQCWDVPNVFVTDGSCFASSGWQNPTLTIMALAARAAEYIVTQVRQGRL
jgi:choline dehydrogenase-like flavoprotein